MNKIVLYIASSQEGFIADTNGGVDWLPHPENDHDLEIFGYKKLMTRIDTILMGSRSFRQIIGFGDWAWPDKQTYVFSSKPFVLEQQYIIVTSDNPIKFMNQMQSHTSGKDIWLLGGAQLAKSFERAGLIDEIILTIVPQILGDGIALGLNFDHFDLKNEKTFMDGIIQRTYLRNK